MRTNANLGLASNEAKEQRIMLLRKAFNNQEVVTINAAVQKTGFTEQTVKKWAREGNIPLIDTKTGEPVVPMSEENTPSWLKN